MDQSNLPKQETFFDRLSPYWWCQLLGWGVVIPYWLHFEQPVNGSYAIPLFYLLCQAASQIFVTNQYRHLAHRYGWINRSARRLIPVVACAYLLLLAQYLLMTVVVVTFRYGNIISWDIMVGATAGGARYHAIWLLCFHGYHFARKSARAEAAVARGQQLAAEAQLAKLHTELNPHFLFNALNGIKALTRENPVNSRQAIDRLAGLLRYSLRQSERPLVPLTEEIAMVKEYVALEQMRLEERLQVGWEIPPAVGDCQLPPLSLHTLVENGIKHGINQVAEGGTITIALQKTPHYWHFSVTNVGVFKPNSTEGTGLKNLRQRLELQYDEVGLLHHSNTVQDGIASTRAVLKIPRK